MFVCSKCGACCRLAKKLLGHLDVGFPYAFKEDGSCEKYDPAVGCIVYEDRPDVCRVDVAGGICTTVLNITEEEYYTMTINSCNEMMDSLGIDQSFRI